MREYKLRLSQMIPNAWFYKLRDMARNRRQSGNSMTTRSQKKKQQTFSCFPSAKTPSSPKPLHYYSRKSHYFTRDFTQKAAHSSPTETQFLEPPKTSSPEKLHAGDTSLSLEPAISVVEGITREISPVRTLAAGVFCPSPGCCNAYDKQKGVRLEEPERKLRPIVTKPTNPKNRAKPASFQDRNGAVSRNIIKISPNHTPGGGGVRLKQSPPRFSARKSFNGGRKSTSSRRSLSDSVAVMKTSVDPQRDFKDSMMEMIIKNNINASKDFEELLACYLCLNSDEHHYVIIKVFKQIWIDLAAARFPVKNHILKQH